MLLVVLQTDTVTIYDQNKSCKVDPEESTVSERAVKCSMNRLVEMKI